MNEQMTQGTSVQYPQVGRSGLAIAALVLGIVALATSFIPIINNGSFFIGLVGLILAIVGMVQTGKGKKSGRGLAIAGLVLNIVACIAVLASQAFYSSALDNALSTSGSVVTSSKPADSIEASASQGASANDNATGSADVDSTKDMPLETTADVGDGLQVTVNSITPGLKKYDGSEVVAVNVTYVNSGSDVQSFNPYDWKAESSQGVQTSTTYYDKAQDELHSGTLAAGGTITGNIYFVPDVVKVIYYDNMLFNESNVSWVA